MKLNKSVRKYKEIDIQYIPSREELFTDLTPEIPWQKECLSLFNRGRFSWEIFKKKILKVKSSLPKGAQKKYLKAEGLFPILQAIREQEEEIETKRTIWLDKEIERIGPKLVSKYATQCIIYLIQSFIENKHPSVRFPIPC